MIALFILALFSVADEQSKAGPVEPASAPPKTLGCAPACDRKAAQRGEASRRAEQPMVDAESERLFRSAIGDKMRAHLSRCMPGGYAKAAIITTATLRLDKNGRLLNVYVSGQSGVNDSNRPIADVHRNCVIRAARNASPFDGMPAFAGIPEENYHQWKSWQVSFRIR